MNRMFSVNRGIMTSSPGRAMLMLNMIILLVLILHPDLSVRADDDKDPFTLNVTMKNYQSTKVLFES